MKNPMMQVSNAIAAPERAELRLRAGSPAVDVAAPLGALLRDGITVPLLNDRSVGAGAWPR